MYLGLVLILSPFTYLFSFIPFLGAFVNGIIYFLAFIFTFLLASIVITSAYIFYRPLLAIPILVASLLLILYSLLSLDTGAAPLALENKIRLF
jgi:hypothetical protein